MSLLLAHSGQTNSSVEGSLLDKRGHRVGGWTRSPIVRQIRSIPLSSISPLDTFQSANSLISLPEHKIENRSVGGSIPPLGTNHFNDLGERGNLLDTWCRMLAASDFVLKSESRIELIGLHPVLLTAT
jgi:hypothetical protein